MATTQRNDVRPEHQLYHEYTTEVDQTRTNVHYEQPPEFFLLITGGDWNVYSANQAPRTTPPLRRPSSI